MITHLQRSPFHTDGSRARYARNVCDFSQDDTLTLFYLLSSVRFLVSFKCLYPFKCHASTGENNFSRFVHHKLCNAQLNIFIELTSYYYYYYYYYLIIIINIIINIIFCRFIRSALSRLYRPCSVRSFWFFFSPKPVFI